MEHSRVVRISTILLITLLLFSVLCKLILSQNETSNTLHIFIFSALFIMSIYFLCLFAFRPDDKVHFYFGLACLFMGIVVITTNRYYASNILVHINGRLIRKINHLSMYICIPLISLFFRQLFTKEIPVYFCKLLSVVSGIFFLFAIIMPLSIEKDLNSLYSWLILVSTALILFALYKAFLHKQTGAFLTIFGTLFLIVSVICTKIYETSSFPFGNYTLFGILIFMLFNSLTLIKNLSTSLTKVEDLSRNLMSIDKLKDEFLANTTHELKTPLNGIIGISESLIDDTMDPISEKAKVNLTMVVSSAKRLINLVNDLLDFSKLRSGNVKLKISPINLKELSDTILIMFQPMIKNKDIKFVNNISKNLPIIHGDNDKVEQILYNLLGNAVKFTLQGTISLNARETQNEIEITIEDTGIGIPENKLGMIFRAFQQVDSGITREFGGVGLGLSITKSLVELHGGSINVKSKEGAGSKFIFTLPKHQKCKLDASSENSYTELGASLHKIPTISSKNEGTSFTNFKHISSNNNLSYKILVVDDEPINLQVIINQMSVTNYDIVTASSGYEALTVLEEHSPFDLVILDIMMPKISGYEVCQEIRKKYSMFELPVLMLTAKNGTKDLITGFDVGANDYIIKPFDKEEIAVRVKTLLSLKRSVERALSHARQYESERKQFILAEKLREMAWILNSTLDLHEVHKNLLTGLTGLIGFDRAAAIIKDGDRINLMASVGYTSEDLEFFNTLSFDNNKILKSITNTLNPVVVNDIENSSEYKFDCLSETSGDFIGVPLIVNSSLIGAILLHSNKCNVYREFEIDLVYSFASQAGIALQNAKLFNEVKQLAVIDELTNLYNRRYFFEQGNRELKRAKRYKRPLSLIMVDIDHFKDFNDSYGHDTGDLVLKAFSKECSGILRQTDFMGRYGGEEFAILLTDTDTEGAAIAAEKLRCKIERTPVISETYGPLSVTASFGVSSLKDDITTLEELIKSADIALYEAKNNGRNCVVKASMERIPC